MAKAPAKIASKATTVPRINIGISDRDRAAIAKGLSHLLVDTETLDPTTHKFHLNVTGSMFNTLHSMFMGHYTELRSAVDPIAERIRALGRVSPGSYAQFGTLASLPDAPAAPPHALEMVRVPVTGHRSPGKWPAPRASCFRWPDKSGDEPPGDLLTQRMVSARANGVDVALVVGGVGCSRHCRRLQVSEIVLQTRRGRARDDCGFDHSCRFGAF